MNTQKHKIFAPLNITVALAIIFFSSSALSLTRAEDGQQTPLQQEASSSEAEFVSCQEPMKEAIIKNLDEFRDFIDQHFQNKSSTSSLLEDAFKKFDELFVDLDSVIVKHFPKNVHQMAAMADISTCISLRDDALAQARSFIVTKAEATSTVKQTTALLDKYKAINDKLAALNLTMVNFKSLMETLAVKVPCYLDKCGS
jgi:hypothetical protein